MARGWIALVGPEYEENLSLRYLAASLARAGFPSRIVPFNRAAGLGGVLDAICAGEPPLLVGLSLAFQWRAKDFLALAMALRQRGYGGHVTAGGHFATFACGELLRDFPEFDSICRQEAEETLPRLARAVADGESLDGIPGLARRGEGGAVLLGDDPPLPDLASLPRPDRRGPPASCFGHGIAPLVGSRGCYANCSFCCIAAWHEQSLPGKRYRMREPDDVADEMAELHRARGCDIFVFHDDNFFLPGHKANLARIAALADALDARGVGRFATVVKARPVDVHPEVFRLLVERLGCIRAYVGIETDADQGLITLNRWAASKQNHRAIETARALGLYTCFNLLLFDPDTTVENLRTNVAFIRAASEFAFNFGRVELYAGTPLLKRMQFEKRTWGDYLQWDYALASPEMERIFQLTMRCFGPRNFGDDATANNLMGTRFDVEVARRFHPRAFRPAWSEAARELSRVLAIDTADRLDAIVDHVVGGAPAGEDDGLVGSLSANMRATERVVRAGAIELAREMAGALGGKPLTEIGDRVATPLQDARPEGLA